MPACTITVSFAVRRSWVRALQYEESMQLSRSSESTLNIHRPRKAGREGAGPVKSEQLSFQALLGPPYLRKWEVRTQSWGIDPVRHPVPAAQRSIHSILSRSTA